MRREPCVVEHHTFDQINPAEIFGKDANRLLVACNQVMHDRLYEYEGCYRSPSHPTLWEVRENMSKGDSFIAAYKAAMTAWKIANPEEADKERASREAWENNRDKQFRIIYGIAKRHGLYLEWHGTGGGPCEPDRWTIYRNNMPIAHIGCV